MRAGTKSAKIGKDSPVGDLQAKKGTAMAKFFHRPIKKIGTNDQSVRRLRVRAFKKAGGND